MRQFVMALVALISSSAFAGDFVVTSQDSESVRVHYTGFVLDTDADDLAVVMSKAKGRTVYLTIDSPGGSAWGGLALFWEAERHINLITIAGDMFGAYSAAAIFWMGSPRDYFESKEARVCFHSAYCDSRNPPGCNTLMFQIRLGEAFNKAGYNGTVFNLFLNQIQSDHGVSGWAMMKGSKNRWFFYDSRFGFTVPMKPIWTK